MDGETALKYDAPSLNGRGIDSNIHDIQNNHHSYNLQDWNHNGILAYNRNRNDYKNVD